ncbi:hypothetical protein N0V83_005326 [Neocucurbitaria cava]|uniref:BZIP domain-containing protein n=1 Tax=Neocucurbitaria cava TaxID=798079 RepID=A0A9W9CL59_9PLEO|nr:hypothetical protein N0V83_005326 [Neocucurbitaria cava]
MPYSPSSSMTGKVIAITGGASGIGLATAHLLASRGATLSLADVSEQGLQDASKSIKAKHNVDILTFVLDVRKPEQVDGWIEETVAKFGKLDGAANIAGVIPKTIGVGGIAELEAEEWNFVIGVNLTGVMHCLRAQMKAISDGGSIVNAASIAGLQGRPNNAAYSASKHGVIGLTKSAAKEIGAKGVRVNSFAPGYIITPMTAAASKTDVKASKPSSICVDYANPGMTEPGKNTIVDEKIVAERLARKRTLDRKAQQAARSRTKWTIENLQYQVAHLNNALVNETSRLQSLLQESNDEAERVRAENQALRAQLQDAISVGPGTSTENLEVAAEGAGLWDGDIGDVAARIPDSRSLSVSSAILQPQPYESIPWNTEPTCVSDRILQSYAAAARMQVHATSDIFLKDQPDVTALLAQEHSTDNPGVSNIVSDILLTYQEINTLPKKAACLYVMYKLLNWLIYRTKLTHDQMPTWLRPVPLQLQVEHPAWIDRIPWPGARVYLINNPQITFDDFATYYSSSFHLAWPYDHSHVFISLPREKRAAPEAAFNDWFLQHNQSGETKVHEDPVLNPVFEQHLRQLKNWSVSDGFRCRFPELSDIIDRDSRLEPEEPNCIATLGDSPASASSWR